MTDSTVSFFLFFQLSEGEGEGGEKGTGLEKVKNLGNFLFSTIKGAGQKIKDTVSWIDLTLILIPIHSSNLTVTIVSNFQNILSEFQREHDSFLKSKMGKTEAISPWIGHPKEEALKEEILSLSSVSLPLLAHSVKKLRIPLLILALL